MLIQGPETACVSRDQSMVAAADGDVLNKTLCLLYSDYIWEPKADTICCGQIQQHLREYRDAICDCHILLWTNATTFETV